MFKLILGKMILGNWGVVIVVRLFALLSGCMLENGVELSFRGVCVPGRTFLARQENKVDGFISGLCLN